MLDFMRIVPCEAAEGPQTDKRPKVSNDTTQGEKTPRSPRFLRMRGNNNEDHNVKTCQVCGKPFRAVSNRAKYCAGCSKKAKRRKTRERVQKFRGSM